MFSYEKWSCTFYPWNCFHMKDCWESLSHGVPHCSYKIRTSVSPTASSSRFLLRRGSQVLEMKPCSQSQSSIEMIFADLLKSVQAHKKQKLHLTEEGDLIDCIHIYSQPAFDHPLLKDHVIKMRPSTVLPSVKGESATMGLQQTQRWLESGECPEGTIPMLRLPKQHGSSAYAHPTQRPVNASVNWPSTAKGTPEYSMARGKFDAQYGVFGGTATLSVWNPKTAIPEEFSLLKLAVLSGVDPYGLTYSDAIEAGWMVLPSRYGDPSTRFYTYWRSVQSGCLDVDCPGFVQVSSKVLLGARLPISTSYDRSSELQLRVIKDHDENWWLYYSAEAVGYWPQSLFTYLSWWANTTEVGGQIWNSRPEGHHTTTEMGNGHYGSEGRSSSCYFTDIYYINGDRDLKPLDFQFKTIVTDGSCYDFKRFTDHIEGGIYYMVGGSGYNANCP